MALRLAAVAVALALITPATAAAADVVIPAQGRERGTIMFFHGGAFGWGSTGSELANARLFATRGWRAVVVDYPLMDLNATFSGSEQRATQLRGRRPLLALGESAGGTIAAWLAARQLVDAAVAVDAPMDLAGWPQAQPDAVLSFIPGFVTGFSANAWRWSPARIYNDRSSPLMVVTASGDQFVGPEHATLMQTRGAELVRVPGGHMVSLRWRRPAAAFLRRVTRR